MELNQFSSPDHYLSQEPTRSYTPPHAYPQIVVPLNNLEAQLVQRLADLMEWSIGDPEQGANLHFLLQETFQQFGDCYDQSYIAFVSRLQGNLAENGNVPGYPSQMSLQHLSVVMPDKWPQYVVIFRHMAMELYALVNMFLASDQTASFVFHKWISGGLVFYRTPRTIVYDIG